MLLVKLQSDPRHVFRSGSSVCLIQQSPDSTFAIPSSKQAQSLTCTSAKLQGQLQPAWSWNSTKRHSKLSKCPDLVGHKLQPAIEPLPCWESIHWTSTFSWSSQQMAGRLQSLRKGIDCCLAMTSTQTTAQCSVLDWDVVSDLFHTALRIGQTFEFAHYHPQCRPPSRRARTGVVLCSTE